MDAATEHDDNERCACISNHINEFLLDAREIEAGSIVALANGCRAHDAAAPCDHNYSNVGITRCLDRFSEARAVIALHRAPPGVLDLHAISQSRAQACKRRDVWCEVRARSIRFTNAGGQVYVRGIQVVAGCIGDLHVGRVVIVTLEESLVICAWPNDCDAFDPGGKR